MYLFSRAGRLRPGNTREAMAWAMGITERVNQITELNVSLWTAVFSPGVGTLTWAAVAEDLAMLEAAQDKLAVDEQFVAEVDRGAAYSSGEALNDRLGQIVHGPTDSDRRPQYAAVVEATIIPGCFARGVGLASRSPRRPPRSPACPPPWCSMPPGPTAASAG